MIFTLQKTRCRKSMVDKRWEEQTIGETSKYILWRIFVLPEFNFVKTLIKAYLQE